MKTEQPPLAIAADNVIENCLGVKDGEVVTVLTDTADEERVRSGGLYGKLLRKGAQRQFTSRCCLAKIAAKNRRSRLQL
jgi:hypothetical protein